MDNPDLTTSVQELMAQITALGLELDALKQRANVIVPPEPPVKLAVSTTRRKVLRQLAGGLLAGLVVGTGTGAAALPEPVEAKFVSNAGTRIATAITTSGSAITGDLPTGTTYKYGLLAYNGNGTTLDTTTAEGFADGGTAVYARGNSTYAMISYSDYTTILARSTSNTVIIGYGQTGNAIYGSSVNGIGVEGYSSYKSGVYGHSITTNFSGVEGQLLTVTGCTVTVVPGLKVAAQFLVYMVRALLEKECTAQARVQQALMVIVGLILAFPAPV
jgi:hypothetical protein